MQISNKSAVLDTISEIKSTLGSEDNWTKTGEAMTKAGQPTSPTSRDAASYNLTGAIKRGVMQVGQSHHFAADQLDAFEQEVEGVFTSCLQESGFDIQPGGVGTMSGGQNQSHPAESVLSSWSEQQSYPAVRDLLDTAREKVINYSD